MTIILHNRLSAARKTGSYNLWNSHGYRLRLYLKSIFSPSLEFLFLWLFMTVSNTRYRLKCKLHYTRKLLKNILCHKGILTQSVLYFLLTLVFLPMQLNIFHRLNLIHTCLYQNLWILMLLSFWYSNETDWKKAMCFDCKQKNVSLNFTLD